MALRAVKTEEEAAAIPMDQPILIELPDGVQADNDVDSPGEAEKPSAPDVGAKSLQEQLEAMEAARKIADERAAKAERDATEARRQAADRTRELDEQRARSESLEGEIVTGGLAAAQADLAAAKAEYIRFAEAGDFAGQADAQAKIGRASARVVALEGGAAELAERKERPVPQQQRESQNADPMAAIDANPNLMLAEKEWLKAHPDSVMDNRRNARLGVAYDDAIAKGLVRGTQDYFKHLEEFMGYAKPATPSQERTADVQAPVTRNERSGDGRVNTGKITLSPEQREIARNLGVSDVEYAKQVAAFEVARKAEPEKYR